MTSCLRRATYRTSPAFPVFPRACGSSLSLSCLLNCLRRSFLWRFFCSFSFLAACRRAKSDGFVHEAFLQRAAPRPFSRALVLSLPRLFWPVRPFEPLPGSPGGALTARSRQVCLLLCSWPARCLSKGGPVRTLKTLQTQRGRTRKPHIMLAKSVDIQDTWRRKSHIMLAKLQRTQRRTRENCVFPQ